TKMEKERDVLLASEATHAQGRIVEGGESRDEEVELSSALIWETVGETMGVEEILRPRRSARNVGVKELQVSDEEEQVDEEEYINFESDEDRVLEGYGEEDEEI
ncbi:hypothetical protein Dimus_026938, partial [Dionaea muscipula]